MELKEKVKTNPGYTIAALLWVVNNKKVLPGDVAFLENLAQIYQTKNKLGKPQVKAVARIVSKYINMLPEDLLIKPNGIVSQEKNNEKMILTISTECCLENASEILCEAIKSELTIANKRYQEAVKYGRWIGSDMKPFLYFFTEEENKIIFPRGFMKQALKLCDGLSNQLPTIIDKQTEHPEHEFMFTGELRPYQQDAFDEMIKHDIGVLESGTGSGKTVLGLAMIAFRKQPTIILVHSKELLYQWEERIQQFLGITPGLVGDGKCHISSVTIAIVNSAKNRLDELTQHFGQIIVDECHRVPASLFTKVVTGFDCRYILGLSATAFRHDGLTDLINLYLGETHHRVPLDELHKNGAVLKPEFTQIFTGFGFKYNGDYTTLIKTLAANQSRNERIVDNIYEEIQNDSGTILVVSDRINHCRRLHHYLKMKDDSIRIMTLTGRLDSTEREIIVKRVRNNQVNVLISTIQLIGEGFDCPGLCSLFLTTPIKAKGRLLQVIGRILRPAKGKTSKIFDYVDDVSVLENSARARRKIYKEQGYINARKDV